MEKPENRDIGEVLAQVREQLAALAQRIERLEAATTAQARLPARAAAPPEPTITEEDVLAISAAIAAYVGVRLRVRQIRLVSSTAWAQEGRVSIQASHRLHN